jgi:glycyl-tRNA synthetase beta subunit
MEIVDVAKKVRESINKKISNIDKELEFFLNVGLEEKLKYLKSVPYFEFDSCYDRTMKIVELSRFLSFFVSCIDLKDIELVAKISEIDATTYITKIVPELKDFLIYSFAKNRYGENVCNSYNFLTKEKQILILSQLIYDIVVNFLLKKKDCSVQIIGFIKLIIENEVDISLNILLDKTILLFKKKQSVKKLKSNILGAFELEIKKYFKNDNLFINNKTINILSIYRKANLNKDFSDETKVILNFYKKSKEIIKKNKFFLIKIRNKNDILNKEFKKEYKNLFETIKKNKSDYRAIIVLLAGFAQKIVNFLEKNEITSNNDKMFLSKIRKKFGKYL